MKQRFQYQQALPVLLLGLLPLAHGAETIPLPALEKRLPEMLLVQAAAAAAAAAKHGLDEVTASSGWRLGADFAAAHHRPLVKSDVTPSYTGVDAGVKLSYPFWGSRAKEQEAIINAGAEHTKSDVDFAAARRQALYTLRIRYITYWQAQDTSRVAEDFRAALAARVKATAAERKEGMWTAADMLHFRNLENQATLEVEKAAGQSGEALSGLRSLLGADLPVFAAQAPDMAGLCATEALLEDARRADPTLGRLLAQLNAVRAEQGLTEWRHIGAAFILGAHITKDVSGHRHGNGAAIGVELSLPLGAAEAKRARHDRLDASAHQLSLQIAQQENELAYKLDETMANYRLAEAVMRQAQSQAEASAAALAQSQARFHEVPGNILAEVINNTAAAHEVAIALVSAKTNVMAQAAALALLAPEACKGGELKSAVQEPEAKHLASEPGVNSVALLAKKDNRIHQRRNLRLKPGHIKVSGKFNSIK